MTLVVQSYVPMSGMFVPGQAEFAYAQGTKIMSLIEGSALHQSRESSLRSRRDAMALVNQALVEDPEDALAHATRGFYYYGERHHRNAVTIQECADSCSQFVSGADQQARHYCNALTAASEGNATGMVYHLEQQLLDDPTDIIALKLCQSELFWLGEMKWSASISAGVAPRWNSKHDYYSDYLAIRAFDLEETGNHELAEKLGRESVAINPADVWGTHAVTHVMYMQGRGRDGALWLDKLHAGGHWDGLGQMVLHLWWHRALFHLINEEPDAALAVYDDYLRNFEIDMVAALPDLYLDLQNATSLLLRLELIGVDVGGRWAALADLCSERTKDQSNAFSCAHYAAVLAADGRFSQTQELIDNMQATTRTHSATVGGYVNAALPAASASVAHRKNDYRKVIDLLMPARYQLVQMGGSHAQREVFLLLLADALLKEGEVDMLNLLSSDLQETGFSEIMAHRILN